MKPIVGHLDEDEEDRDGGAVDAQSHGGRGQGLWRGEVVLHYIQTDTSESSDFSRTVFGLMPRAAAV